MIDITDLGEVKKVINDIESQENRDRKAREWKSYTVYAGDQHNHVLDALKKSFPESWGEMIVSNVNVLKKVVDKIARVYKEQPSRQLTESSDDSSLDLVYGEGDFNRSFRKLDETFVRHKYCLAWVRNNAEFKTMFDMKVLAPYLFDVVLNPDTNELELVVLSYPDTEITANHPEGDNRNQIIADSQADSAPKVKTYAMWTKDRHVVVRAQENKFDKKSNSIDFVVDEGNVDMVNPLGVLPFCFVTTDPDIPEYPIPNSLSEESININKLNSSHLTGAAISSVGQMVIKYPEGSSIKKVHRGFSVAIELPQSNDPDAAETTAEYISPSPNLSEIRQSIFDYAASVMADHGLTNVSLAGKEQNFASGFDRMLAMADVTEAREDNISVYKEVEVCVFDIIKKYDEVNQTRLFDQDDRIIVEYKKPKILQTEKERLDVIQKKMDLGLLEEWEKFVILNPNMSEQEAREKIERIRSEKQSTVNSFFGSQVDGSGQEN